MSPSADQLRAGAEAASAGLPALIALGLGTGWPAQWVLLGGLLLRDALLLGRLLLGQALLLGRSLRCALLLSSFLLRQACLFRSVLLGGAFLFCGLHLGHPLLLGSLLLRQLLFGVVQHLLGPLPLAAAASSRVRQAVNMPFYPSDQSQ